jgi:hypothetical protein
MFSRKAHSRIRLALVVSPLAFLLQAIPVHATTFADVEFVMASNGGITASGWQDEKEFVLDAIENILPLDSTRVGIVEFSTDTQVKLLPRTLTSSSQSGIMSVVSGLSYWAENTYVSDGVKAGVQQLINAGPPSDDKLMVLLSNGRPNPSLAQNPCDTSGTNPDAAGIRQSLAANNIFVLEILVGPDTLGGSLSCLVHSDPARIVTISGASSALSALFSTNDTVSSVPEPGAFGFATGALSLFGLAVRRRRMPAGAQQTDAQSS